jgi:hypothetical protein
MNTREEARKRCKAERTASTNAKIKAARECGVEMSQEV